MKVEVRRLPGRTPLLFIDVPGQVAVAGFSAPDQLQSIGSNLFAQSQGSGQPVIGAPGAGGRASLVSGSLEQSNVDLAEQLQGTKRKPKIEQAIRIAEGVGNHGPGQHHDFAQIRPRQVGRSHDHGIRSMCDQETGLRSGLAGSQNLVTVCVGHFQTVLEQHGFDPRFRQRDTTLLQHGQNVGPGESEHAFHR